MDNINKRVFLTIALSALLLSCSRPGCTDSNCSNYDQKATEDDGSCQCEDSVINYIVPTTYDFSNVNTAGQELRLAMLSEMVAYLKRGDAGFKLSSDTLKAMFDHQVGEGCFNDAALNESAKQIKNKTYSLVVDQYVAYLDSAAVHSGDTVMGVLGTAGLVLSNDGEKSYLCDANGFEYTQMFEKGLFGAFIFNQIANNYLTEEKIGNAVDNQTVVDGNGTNMEHHWDEAFGYFGVPTDFPSNTSSLKGIGKYANKRDALLGCNALIMGAFIKGRASISNNAYSERDSQVVIITNEIERVLVATAIHYLNAAKSNIADDALRNHELSEAVAFTHAAAFNPTGKISLDRASQITALLGDNLYEVSILTIEACKNELSSLYNLDDVKDEL